MMTIIMTIIMIIIMTIMSLPLPEPVSCRTALGAIPW